jgi:hypothetical protein
MKDRLRVLVVVMMGLILVLVMGCGPQDLGCGSPEVTGPPVKILAVEVAPSSGTGAFQATVSYEWQYAGPPQIPTLEPIICSYFKPNGDRVNFGEVDPALSAGGAMSGGQPGLIQDSQTLNFNVKSEYALAEPGVYTVKCYLMSNPSEMRQANFTVVAEDTTTTSVAEQTTTSSASTTTTTQPIVYNLQEQMQVQGTGSAGGGYRKYVQTATWGGAIPVAPDGSLRAKLAGTIEAAVPLELNGKHGGDYRVMVTFNVDVAGSVQEGQSGPVVRLQQTIADYKVQPVTVVSGNIPAGQLPSLQTAIQEAAPGWWGELLTALGFEATSLPMTQDVVAGLWKGAATLSQLK